MSDQEHRQRLRIHEKDRPTFFRYCSHVSLSPSDLKLPINIVLLLFDSEQDALCDPGAEPIAAYYEAGVRHYFWRGDTWVETDLNKKAVVRHIHRLLKGKCSEVQRPELLYILSLLDKGVGFNDWLRRGAPNLRGADESSLASIRDRLDDDNDRIALDRITNDGQGRSIFCRSVYRAH